MGVKGKETRECGYIGSPSVPQGRDRDGLPIWICKCGNFRTSSSEEFQDHLDGDAPVLLPLAILSISTVTAYWFFDYSIMAAVLFLISAFPISFCINHVLDWRGRKERKEKYKVLDAPLALSSEPLFDTSKRKKEQEDLIRVMNEKAADFDPTDKNLHSLRKFSNIVQKSECLFARKAKVWGSCDWDNELSLEENVQRNLKAMDEGLVKGRQIKLDAFLIEVCGSHYGDTLESFSNTMLRVLTTISDHDPQAEHCMNSEIIDRRGWRFSFSSIPIFVTCFAPCYPEDHARYSFGEKESCFVLLQPMYSFGIHDIGEDHPWDDTKNTIRQKIRQKFKNAGRLYWVPKARFYPMAPMIVPPIGLLDPLIPWYKKKKERTGDMTPEKAEAEKNEAERLRKYLLLIKPEAEKKEEEVSPQDETTKKTQ